MCRVAAEDVNNLDDPGEIEPLDVTVKSDLNRQVKDITLTVTIGGPHIDIELGNERVIGYWGSERTSAPINTEKSDILWDWYERLWENQ